MHFSDNEVLFGLQHCFLPGVSSLNTVLPGTDSNDARATALPGCGMAGKGTD